jgi:hypothetical protein
VTAYNSSPNNAWRAFCSRCGTNLTWVRLHSKNDVPGIDVAFGTLDRESLEVEGLRPVNHSYLGLGIDWVKELFGKGLPSFLG